MLKVLFLEPDKVLGITYAQALGVAGFKAVSCRSAQEAIELMDSFAPDILVTELHMVAHDGIEFLQELRSYPEWQAMPVIILTAIAPQTFTPLRAALERDLGVRRCLYKPRTSLQQLTYIIREEIMS